MMTEDEETAIKHGVALIMNVALDANDFCQMIQNDPPQAHWSRGRQQAWLAHQKARLEKAQWSLANVSAALEWLLSSTKPTRQ